MDNRLAFLTSGYAMMLAQIDERKIQDRAEFEFERVRMKGLSSEQMGTKGKKKGSRRRRRMHADLNKNRK